jgi:hypothetical protein
MSALPAYISEKAFVYLLLLDFVLCECTVFSYRSTSSWNLQNAF